MRTHLRRLGRRKVVGVPQDASAKRVRKLWLLVVLIVVHGHVCAQQPVQSHQATREFRT